MEYENLVLAADVGGTKTQMTLFHEENCELTEIKTHKYASSEFESLDAIIEDFLQEYEQTPEAASFGIPGPVENGVVKSTNLPWVIDEKVLSKNTGIPKINLMNDLVATAYSIPHLGPDEVINIRKGDPIENPERFVVLAPGTGLGQSFLVCKDGKTTVIPSEGGHVNFAPTSEIETRLYTYLQGKFKRVSYERIISGSGLPNVFDFFVEVEKMEPKPETLEKMKNEDRAKVISEMALDKKDEVCEKTLDLFVSILGAHAGNLALTFLADGGVYLAGGVPFKILSKIKDGNFVESFLNKGRLSSVLEGVPIYLITNNLAALKGAAQVAQTSCQLKLKKTE